jgi:hypothetical protein
VVHAVGIPARGTVVLGPGEYFEVLRVSNAEVDEPRLALVV